eukprot:14142721-Ditylum_brightwellii.AAC.2
MAFGWSIQDDNKMILAKCAGPAFGSCQSSFHAELYGMLSGVWFIYNVSAFTNSPINWIIEGSEDNEGLIKQVNQQLTYSNDHPSNTLDSKWDLIKQTAVTIQTTEQQPKISHVQGHQDNDTPHKEFDGCSQQNVDANHLASEFLENNAEIRVLVPHVAVNTAQLTIQGRSITSHYATEIKRLATYGPLYSYVQEKNKWPKQQIDSIDWSTFSSAFK